MGGIMMVSYRAFNIFAIIVNGTQDIQGRSSLTMYPPLDLRKGSPDSDPGESKSYNSDMHYSTIYPPLILKQIRNDITTPGKLQNERLQTEKKLKTGVDYNDFLFKYDSTTLSKNPSF